VVHSTRPARRCAQVRWAGMSWGGGRRHPSWHRQSRTSISPDADVARWAAQPIDLGLGLGILRPLVLGPASVPELTDPATAEQEIELSVLSAVAHGNGPNGLAVVQAALVALGGVDREHAAVYFQIIWNALRGPMRRALKELVMERQTEDKATMLPFMQEFFEDGLREGKLDGLREALLRLITRTGITLTEDDRARIETCDDTATLDRWIENVLGAKTASDILS
jgi:hypothetical protein